MSSATPVTKKKTKAKATASKTMSSRPTNCYERGTSKQALKPKSPAPETNTPQA
jgi:hypothetical protein